MRRDHDRHPLGGVSVEVALFRPSCRTLRFASCLATLDQVRVTRNNQQRSAIAQQKLARSLTGLHTYINTAGTKLQLAPFIQRPSPASSNSPTAPL